MSFLSGSPTSPTSGSGPNPNQGRIDTLTQERDRVSKKRTDLTEQRGKIESSELIPLRKERETLDKEIQEARQALNELETKRKDLTGREGPLESRVLQMDNEIDRCRDEVEKKDGDIERLSR